jgi:hypothetical protein
MEQGFMNFVNDRCVVRRDVRVSVCDLRGAIMIYFRTTEEEKIESVISSLLYEGHCTRALMIEYETGKPVHAMKGLKLRDVIIENKNFLHEEEETFVNMCCDYSPRRKVVFEVILDEYLDWRKRNGMKFDRELHDHTLKDYLDNREYIIAGRIDDYRGKYGDGYYGIGLKSQSAMTKIRRKNEIEKCDLHGNILVTHYDLFDAVTNYTEGRISKKEISKFIRDRTTIDGTHGEYFYRKKVYHI